MGSLESEKSGPYQVRKIFLKKKQIQDQHLIHILIGNPLHVL